MVGLDLTAHDPYIAIVLQLQLPVTMSLNRPVISILAVVSAALLGGCAGDDAVVDPNKLCARGAGVAARISGGAAPVEMCVSNDEASATYRTAPGDRYELSATFVADSVEHSITIHFFVQSNLPRGLSVTSDSTQAAANPGSVWFTYRESKPGVFDYTTSSVTGMFTLTASDQSVAVGTFSDIAIDVENVSDGMPAGSRVISEGFFAVTPD